MMALCILLDRLENTDRECQPFGHLYNGKRKLKRYIYPPTNVYGDFFSFNRCLRLDNED